ncbi:hypothetical protein [Streptomyces nanshensis]|uniref:Uncharacterized protein n=1 Tax=Streptomyces nanshensis TaxID=518642 RepID=A0A1E7LCW8_9ACTN|nr:hypothetical protein [Streptomyces nanshensis]OEV14069.1 hypothetical protein AN218_00930 [Streptomyces nanshensis]
MAKEDGRRLVDARHTIERRRADVRASRESERILQRQIDEQAKEIDRFRTARQEEAQAYVALHEEHAEEVDRLRAELAARPAIPAWEAMYEPGNVSDYLIGYTNDEATAKAAAETWIRSQSEVTGRLEWEPDAPLSSYDQEWKLVQRHDDGIDTGPGIFVRQRAADAAERDAAGKDTPTGASSPAAADGRSV